MKPVIDLKIVPATIEDKDLFLRFMQKYFYPEEPMSKSLGRKPESLPSLDMLKEGLSLKAINALDSSEDNTIGIILSTERTSSDKEMHEELIKRTNDPKFEKIVRALEFLEEDSNFWNRVQVNKVFDSLSVATHSNYRGLNIGKKLLQKSLELAKSHGYQYATIECSSIYSARIAADLNYDLYYELSYEKYLNESNEKIFNVEPPHTGIKLYVKKL